MAGMAIDRLALADAPLPPPGDVPAGQVTLDGVEP